MIKLLQTAERTSSVSPINNYVYQRHVFAYKEAIQYLGNNVIELGCGNGYGMSLLAPHCELYVGTDKKVPANFRPESKILFFQSRLPVLKGIGDNSFDTVVCFQVIEHIKDDVKLVKEIHRILKPGGSLLLTTPNKLMSLTRNPYHIREYDPAAMKQIIRSVFDKSVVYGVYGNELVMDYYYKNKHNTDAIARWDVLKLSQRLPATVLKLPYNIANNINRTLLYKKGPGECETMNYTDFYLGEVNDKCIDFFVIGEKQ